MNHLHRAQASERCRVGQGRFGRRPTIERLLRGRWWAGARKAELVPPYGYIVRRDLESRPPYIQISDVLSPRRNRISCARAAPSGSLPKSTRNFSLSLKPPFSV